MTSCCTYHNGNCVDVEEACCHRCPTWTGVEVEWKRIPCAEADRVRASADMVSAGRSDLDGEFGPPEVFTEWWSEAAGGVVLREHRWPTPGIPFGEDRKPCEHYTPAMEARRAGNG